MNDKLDLLIDWLKEMREDLKQMREEQIRQGSDIAKNKDSLIEHMRRTDLLEAEITVHKRDEDVRLQKLEAPSTFIKTLLDLTVKAGAVAAAYYTIYRLLL